MKYLILFLLLSTAACAQSGGESGAPSESPAPAAPPAYQNLSPDEFAARMQDGNVVILDVRTPGEVAGGKIDGAVELDFRDPDFAAKVAALDREPTYLVYCASGGRSSQTCELMSEAGFKKTYNLEGGYTAWKGR